MRRDTYDFYRRYHREFGPCLKFRAYAGWPFYSFAHPDALQHILVQAKDHYSRGAHWRSRVAYLGGNGLVTSIGETWRDHRYCMNGFFQPKYLARYVDQIVHNTQALLLSWQAQPMGSAINISQAMMFLGLINVSDALFGYDIRPMAASFSQAMLQCFDYMQHTIVHPLMPGLWWPNARNRAFKRALAHVDGVADDLLNQRARQESDTLFTALRTHGLSRQALRDEMITLLMAGHDTVASAAAWMWYELARHPRVLQRVQEELQQTLNGQPPTFADLEKLGYLRQVWQETLRLYPSVWAMHRYAERKDDVLGYPVAKYTSLALPVYVVHRDPQYWEKPNDFYPEHFDAGQTRPKYAYLPFGAGERFCIGSQFANMEAMLILAVLLQHLTPTLMTPEPIHPEVAFTLKPARDIIASYRPVSVL